MFVRTTAQTLVPLLMLAGCTATTSDFDTASIGAALEEENGGMEMEDEAPMFGDAEFESLGLGVEDAALDDTMALEPEVAEMMAAPDAVHYRVAVVWGQLPGDRANETPYDWSGILATNRGALVARRTIAFEPLTDRLLPRNDRRFLPFTSMTRPHHDGLVLDIVDPTPESEEPMGLGYIGDLPGPLGAEADPVGVSLRALLEGPVELAVDEAGNRMIAVAHARPIDVCAQGFVMGHWHRLDEGRGRILGRVVGERGELRGHIRGIYGRRANGDRVFFAKYVDLDGAFQGILRGEYADGDFRGRWVTREGERGAVGGQYRESIPGPETGGELLGRWAETTCNARL